MTSRPATNEMSVRVVQLSQSEFADLEVDWMGLLSRSDANPVFMSWCWHYTWWQVFAMPESELRLLAAYDSNGQLVGLAPLYLESSGSMLRSSRRLQLLGSRWRARQNIRTEYLGFILDVSVARHVAMALLDSIEAMRDWDELIICNHDANSTLRACEDLWSARHAHLVREHEAGQTFQLNLKGDFSDYLASLSSKSRLKIYNQRKKLAVHGEIDVHYPQDQAEIIASLDTLNQFHIRRWEKPLLFGLREAFHYQLAPFMAQRSMLDMSVLRVSGQPISILYDFRSDIRKFGFQLGFDQSFDKRLSPNLLHFGYAIEAAYERGMSDFDFLRGAGKSRVSYKERIASASRATSTLQIVRSTRLKVLYRARERLASRSPDGVTVEA